MSVPKAFLASAALLLVGVPCLRAQTLWSGSVNGLNLAWNSTGNWSGGVVPNGTAASADLRKDWASASSLALGSAITLNSLLFNDTGTGDDSNLTIENGGNAANTLAFGGSNPSVNVAGSVLIINASLVGSFSKTGNGDLALFGANTGLTGVTVSAGTLRVGNSSTLGTAALTLAGGALSSTATTARAISGGYSLTGDFTFGNATYNGALTLSGNGSLGGGARILNVVSQTTLSGIVSNGSLTKSGGGLLVLSGANTFNGTTLNAGTLRLSGGDNRLLTTSALTVGGSSTLELNGVAQTLGGLAFADGLALTLGSAGGGALTLSGSTVAANVQVGPGGEIVSGHSVSVDLSGLASFTYANTLATGGVFRVGPKAGSYNNGALGEVSRLRLASSNTLTMSLLAVGDVGLTSDGALSVLELGAANSVNADTVSVGYSGRSDASVGFASGLSGPTLALRGRDGVAALPSLRIGLISHYRSGTFTSAVDLSAGVLDAKVDTVWIGSADVASAANRAGTGVASLTLGQGLLEAGTLVVARSAATTGSSNGTLAVEGTLSLGHASGAIHADTLTVADGTLAGTTVTGIVNLTAGTLRAGVIQKGGNTGTTSGTLNLTAGTVGNRAGSDLSLGAGLAVNLLGSGVAFDALGADNGITVSSPLAGSFGFAKTGDGTLTLAAANTYTGTLEARAGTVVLSGSGRLGAASSGLTLAGGAVDLGGKSQSIGALSVTAGSAGDTLANGSLAASSIAVSNPDGTATLAADLDSGVLTKTGDGTLVLSGSNTLASISVANGGGTVRVTTLAALGAGTLTVSKSGTASGTLELALAGTNVIANAWGNFSSAFSTVSATPGTATLRSSGGRNTLTSALTLANVGGSGINIESAGTADGDLLILAGELASTVSTARTQTLHGAGDGLVTGAITNAGAGAVVLAKDGAGTWTLSGANTHRGATLVHQGTLVVTTSSALGTTDSGVDVRDGATLALSGNLTLGAETFLLRGAGVGGAGALRSLTGDSSLAGDVTLADAATLGVDAGSLSLSGVVSGSFALSKQGSGLLILSAANTFSGGTSVEAGTLRLGHASALGSGAVTIGAAGTLDLNGFTFTGSLTLLSGANLVGGAVNLSAGSADFTAEAPEADIPLSISGTGSLAFGTTSYAGNVAYAGGTVTGSGFTGYLDIAGESVALGSSIGAGTVRLTASRGAVIGSGFARDIRYEGGSLGGLATAGYTGTVTVAEGATLDLDAAGDIARTDAAFAVLAGSTLKGSGTIGGAVTVAGTLAPGNSPGLMEYESGLTLESTSVLEWEFDATIESASSQQEIDAARGTGYDALDVSGGSLVIAAGAQLAIMPPQGYDYLGAFWDQARLFEVIRLGEGVSISGLLAFSNQTTTLEVSGQGRWNILGSFSGDPGVYLEWTPVPEPSTYGLALGALALAAAAARRRRS